MFTRFMPSMMFFFVLGGTLIAQSNRNTMTITSPASIAGDYDVRSAAFGDQTDDVVSGTLVYADDGDDGGGTGTVNDACQPITNNVAGSIALIDRGACAFVDKCRNAQAAGASSVLVCNINPEGADNGGLLTMADSDPPAVDITIPCFFATLETCNILKVELAAGVNVDFSFVEPPCDPITYPATTIWGNVEGQGDFSGGLNGWTVDTSNGFMWDAEGRIDRGAFNGTQPFIDAPTVCNGAVVMDSDFLDNTGTGAFGTGDCPCSDSQGNFVQFCESKLMSPVIDLSSVTDGIVLQWNQAIRQFNSEYYLELSVDGGNTWRDTIQINTDFATNGPHFINDVQRIPLCGYEGESEFRFRFWYRANYYYWAIDDVLLLDEGFADGETIENFYAVAPNFRTPASQVEALPFLTSLLNNGNQTLVNTTVGIDILNATTLTTEFSDSQSYGDLDGCGREDNVIYTATYTPTPGVPTETAPIRYMGTYSLSADNDGDASNDTKSYEFEYTKGTFAKVRPESEVGEDYLAAIAPTSGAEYFTLGNHYHVVNGAEYKATKVRVGLGNTAADDISGFFLVELYKWIDFEAPFGEVGANERALVAKGQALIFSGLPNFRDIEVELESTLGLETVELEDNTDYVLVCHTNPNVTGGAQWRILAASVSDGPEYNYFELGIAAAAAGAPRYGSFFANGAGPDDIDSRTFGSLGTFSLYAPLTIEQRTSGTEDLNNNLNVSVFPNPAADQLFINISLDNSSDVQLEIVNLEGKRVMTQTFNNVKADQLNVNVASLANGIYMANIRTEEGFISKRIIVQK